VEVELDRSIDSLITYQGKVNEVCEEKTKFAVALEETCRVGNGSRKVAFFGYFSDRGAMPDLQSLSFNGGEKIICKKEEIIKPDEGNVTSTANVTNVPAGKASNKRGVHVDWPEKVRSILP
jgi:hypothetical protein